MDISKDQWRYMNVTGETFFHTAIFEHPYK